MVQVAQNADKILGQSFYHTNTKKAVLLVEMNIYYKRLIDRVSVLVL